MKNVKLIKLVKEEILKEYSLNDKLFIEGNQLWMSYAPGSGTTHQIKNENKNKWLSDYKEDEDNYDSIVDEIVAWSGNKSPLKTAKSQYSKSKLYKIPAYEPSNRFSGASMGRSSIAKFSIWADEINDSERAKRDFDYGIPKEDIIQPKGYVWIVLTEEGPRTIMHMFFNRNEAMNWFSSVGKFYNKKVDETLRLKRRLK